jgi:hypothetical protein
MANGRLDEVLFGEIKEDIQVTYDANSKKFTLWYKEPEGMYVILYTFSVSEIKKIVKK